MKSDARRHPKTIRFAEILGIPLYSAWGLLEGLWIFVGEYSPGGAIGKYPSSAIAKAVEWEGNPDDLIDALVKSGFIDQHDCCKEHSLMVHDWDDHISEFIKKRLQRKGLQLSAACPDNGGLFTPNGGQNPPRGGNFPPKVRPTQPNPTQPHPTTPNPTAAAAAQGGGESIAEKTNQAINDQNIKLEFAPFAYEPEENDPMTHAPFTDGVPDQVRQAACVYLRKPWSLISHFNRSKIAEKWDAHGDALLEAFTHYACDPDRSLTKIFTRAGKKKAASESTPFGGPKQQPEKKRKQL